MSAIAFEPTQQIASGTMRPKCWGYHNWSNLLMVHWRVPAGAVQLLLPRGLTVDTWHGDAWVGLVAFHISGIQPRGGPPLPKVFSFLEVNVRTYVHVEGQQPGVWFFSMDAASTLAVLAARCRWNFNYKRADIRCEIADGHLWCESTRRWPGTTSAGLKLHALIHGTAERQDDVSRCGGVAQAGTLDHFLIERYVYYAVSHRGRLVRGTVAHPSYRLHSAEIVELEESLLAAAGIEAAPEPEHVCFSPGLRSQVFSPTAVVELT